MGRSGQNINILNYRLGEIFIAIAFFVSIYCLFSREIDIIFKLFNVIKGDMSLVGPRPLFDEYLELFRDEETVRLSVIPGITGLLQIKARETEDFNMWFKYDKLYIDSWSIWLDLKIILQTPFKLKTSK